MKYFLHLDEDALESSTFGEFLSVPALLSLPTNPNRIETGSLSLTSSKALGFNLVVLTAPCTNSYWRRFSLYYSRRSAETVCRKSLACAWQNSRKNYCLTRCTQCLFLFRIVETRCKNKSKLEGCIDDERQFKMAKRSQAPGDATVLKRFFRDNFVIFRRR